MTNPFEYLYPEVYRRNEGVSYTQVPLPSYISGELYLGPVPCRYESREVFEAWAARKNITDVACLLSNHDILERSPEYPYVINNPNKKWRHRQFPVPDFGIPFDREEYLKFACSIAIGIKEGKITLVHCGAGIGRTGCLSIVVLLLLGFSLEEAKNMTHHAGGSPENEKQWELIHWCQNKIEEAGGPDALLNQYQIAEEHHE
ncbi:MAG TPA: hypothetical protein VN372_10070 [Methanospirillum sp.]|nr:hypothetical protein [Methanospirillum sp.]